MKKAEAVYDEHLGTNNLLHFRFKIKNAALLKKSGYFV